MIIPHLFGPYFLLRDTFYDRSQWHDFPFIDFFLLHEIGIEDGDPVGEHAQLGPVFFLDHVHETLAKQVELDVIDKGGVTRQIATSKRIGQGR